MNIATVVTAWVGTGSEGDPNRPQLTDDYPGITSWSDITGQPSENITPSPNAYTIQIECDDDTLAAIQADADYTVLTAEVKEEPVA